MSTPVVAPLCLRCPFPGNSAAQVPAIRHGLLASYNKIIYLILVNPGGSDGKESPCSAGDSGSIPGCYLLQNSCLEKFMDRTWWATVHGVTKSWTRLKDQHLHFFPGPYLSLAGLYGGLGMSRHTWRSSCSDIVRLDSRAHWDPSHWDWQPTCPPVGQYMLRSCPGLGNSRVKRKGQVIWIVPCLVLKGTSIRFSTVTYQFTFPPTVQEGSLFSTPSPAFIICRFFDDGHSDWCEVMPHCICISLLISAVEHLSSACWPSVCFWRNICLSLLPIFWLGCFLYCAAWVVFIFWKFSPCCSYCLQIFYPIQLTRFAI